MLTFAALLAAALIGLRHEHAAHESARTAERAPAAAAPRPRPTSTVPLRREADAIDRSSDLLPVLDAVEGRTDVDSLTARARILDECWLLSVQPRYFDGWEDSYAAMKPDALAEFGRQVARYRGRCAGIAATSRISSDDRRRAVEAARAAGSIWAKAIEFRTQWRSFDAAELDARIDEILASRNPYAIEAIADTMARPKEGSRYAALAGSNLDTFAWQLASCDLGLDCGQDGRLMREACLFGTACDGVVDFRDLVRRDVLTPAQFEDLEKRETAVLAAVHGVAR